MEIKISAKQVKKKNIAVIFVQGRCLEKTKMEITSQQKKNQLPFLCIENQESDVLKKNGGFCCVITCK